ncbi:MAG: DNA polymerase III subunit gamma/tau [Anaerolineae bacterium]|jgi:DNA polymerase-3 subunit gamma/tau
MAQALYRKWRPRTFEEVVGQEHVVRTLHNALMLGRIHHAYLFAGPRGTGKTTTARLLAKAVNCLATKPADRPCNECTICQAVNESRLLDLIEIDAASNTGVDDVRELRERVGFRPNEARNKVYVIDEVHMLSNAAFNALLKTLEEPPPHAIFVLATTEPQKIPSTILSRCQRFDFRRIPTRTIVSRLEHIAELEGIAADRDALTLIARQATGSMRDAEGMLDQLATYDEEGITVEEVRSALGTGAEEAVMSLTDALASGDLAHGLEIINEAVEHGADPRQFARQMVKHLRALLLTQLGSDEIPLHVPDELQEAFQTQASRFDLHQFTQVVRLFNEAAVEARAAWQPQLPLELAFVEAALPERKAPPPSGEDNTGRPTSAPPHNAPAQPHSAQNDSPNEAGSAYSPPSSSAEEERPAQGMPTLEMIEAHWSQLLQAIRSDNLSLEALLRSGQPVAVEEKQVVIGFAHQFHKGKVEEESNRRTVEDTLSQLLDCPIRIRCVRTHRKDDNRRPTSTQPDPPSSDQAGVEDKLVQAAVKKLGAKVVDR